MKDDATALTATIIREMVTPAPTQAAPPVIGSMPQATPIDHTQDTLTTLQTADAAKEAIGAKAPATVTIGFEPDDIREITITFMPSRYEDDFMQLVEPFMHLAVAGRDDMNKMIEAVTAVAGLSRKLVAIICASRKMAGMTEDFIGETYSNVHLIPVIHAQVLKYKEGDMLGKLLSLSVLLR